MKPTQINTYWRSKLDAFMHDPVSKALDVKTHEDRALAQRLVDAFAENERYEKTADFDAAAADRLPFPHAGKLKSPFDGTTHPFRHPLDGRCLYRLPRPLHADLADETAQTNKPYLEQADSRADFIARWRFWRQWCQERHPGLAFLPADTRIPDHTIWNHLGLTSAFQGCFKRDPDQRVALLIFSIGPVQPLIAAARRIGDLWSGSFLLSYLVSTALGEISREFGPDHVLFPSVWGQPLIDLQLREIYESAKVREGGSETLWDQLWRDNARSRQRFLLPSLPNRFLALLPAAEAENTAQKLEHCLISKLIEIGESVNKHLDSKLRRIVADSFFFPERMTPQLQQTLEVHWQTLDLPSSIEEAKNWGEAYLPSTTTGQPHPARQALNGLERMWKSIPSGSRTSYGLLTPSASWPLSFSVLSWALDAVKQTRLFDAWAGQSGFSRGREQNKDDLTGKEEAILELPDSKEATDTLGRELAGSRALFRPRERLGALTLVKRLWHAAYLCKRHDFKLEDFRMPDTHQLAKGKPFDTETAEEADEDSGGYIAVLALDGDEMGKWISGEKTPPLRHQLAAEAIAYYESEGLAGEGAESGPSSITASEFLGLRRPLNPSFHLQFSEALANFGLYAARRIVEAHNGRLIYAGGDDVLAILPAANALPCARSLRAAFRGEISELADLTGIWKSTDGMTHREEKRLFDRDATQRGFLRLHPDLREGGALRNEPVGYDVIVPGPATEVSCGIAVGHHKSPLQDLVRAAQAAEKRAKNRYQRFAFGLAVFKRSGETVHWGGKWSLPNADPAKLDATEDASLHTETGPALNLFETIREAIVARRLPARFPYKLAALVTPYLGCSVGALGEEELRSPTDSVFAERSKDVLAKEIQHTVRDISDRALAQRIIELFISYWDALDAQLSSEKKREINDPVSEKIEDLLNLLKAVSWFSRQ